MAVTTDPGGWVTAIAAAGHAHAVLIDPRIFFQRCVHAVHHVEVVFAAPFIDDAALELLAITGRPARIREQHRIALRRVDLKLVIPINAVLTRRPTMYAENHRIFLSGLPADRLNQ